MLESISPYMLLKLSKPKEPDVIVTEYDRYSAMQNVPSEPAAAPKPAPEPAAVYEPPEPSRTAQPPMPPFYPPVRRTHYIKDIGSRHESALKSGVQFVHPIQRPDT